jgi:hypothetical protein
MKKPRVRTRPIVRPAPAAVLTAVTGGGWIKVVFDIPMNHHRHVAVLARR